ncbi:uncharacterized protein LOC129582263 isoform X2 [Paramacrobiotus metropolitanus]|uniref:uncharacterized protein LOC129582263 isoform X2 n=1 Tax=Paramacrobiotus metropolitanus TaxID=2943436 RepID=UPI00244615B7|nr:uncharacterized protein LOC129582263 isoform X2 [Paramacrobiotus metropolitanus]
MGFLFVPFSLLIFLYAIFGKNHSSPDQLKIEQVSQTTNNQSPATASEQPIEDGGYNLRFVEKLLVLNSGDVHPATLFPKITNKKDDIVPWTHNRLLLKLNLRMYTAMGVIEPNSTIITPSTATPHYLTVDFTDADTEVDIAQWMVAVGALFSAAVATKSVPVLLHKYAVISQFENMTLSQMDAAKFTEKKGKYLKVPPRSEMSTEHGRILQTWMNAPESRETIQTLLTLRAEILNQSLLYIDTAVAEIMRRQPEVTEWALPCLVGFFVQVENTPEFSATEKRLIRAAIHFQRVDAPVNFFIFSNNMTYCKEIFTEPNVIFVNESPEVQITLMSLMDHFVFTDGVEGWLGAYISFRNDFMYYIGNTQVNDKGNFTSDGYVIFPSWQIFER